MGSGYCLPQFVLVQLLAQGENRDGGQLHRVVQNQVVPLLVHVMNVPFQSPPFQKDRLVSTINIPFESLLGTLVELA